MNLIHRIKSNLNDEHFGEVLKGSIYTLLGRGTGAILALLLQLLIIRQYGAEVLGVTELVNSFLNLIVTLPLLGNHIAILRFIPEYIGNNCPHVAFKVYRKLLYLVIALSVILIPLVIGNPDFVAEKLFTKPQYQTFLLLAGLFIPFRALYEYTLFVTRGLRLIRVFFFLQPLPIVVNLTLLLALTVFYNEYNPIYSLLLGYFVASMTGIVVSEREFGKLNNQKIPNTPVNSSDSLSGSVPSMTSLLSVSLPMFITNSMNHINNQAGVLLLGVLSSEREIAYYAVAAKLASLTNFTLMAINSMVAPKFSELYHTGRIDQLQEVVRKSTKLTFWSSAPVLLGLLLFGRLLLESTYGREFLSSYVPLVILVVGQFVNAMSGAVTLFLNMTGNERLSTTIVFFSCVINLGMSYLLIPPCGIVGAAMASSFSVIFWNLSMVLVIRTNYNILFIHSPFDKPWGERQ
ncbi:MAG: flippase [Geminocystis sp.]|nr:flippase [Geminocystis sp.]